MALAGRDERISLIENAIGDQAMENSRALTYVLVALAQNKRPYQQNDSQSRIASKREGRCEQVAHVPVGLKCQLRCERRARCDHVHLLRRREAVLYASGQRHKRLQTGLADNSASNRDRVCYRRKVICVILKSKI